MENLLAVIVIGASSAFAVFVIYKLIKAGIDDRNRDDQSKPVKGGGSGENPTPKDHIQ